MADISKIQVNGTAYNVKDASTANAVKTKAERTEVKTVIDAFAVSAISGTDDEFLLTIPQVQINATTGALEVVTN